MANSPEYRVLITKGPELSDAFEPVLLPLSQRLVAEGLITPGNHAEIKNPVYPPLADRAAKLIELIRGKVKLNPSGNYHRFIEALRQDKNQFSEIISILNASGPGPRVLLNPSSSGTAPGGGPSQATHCDLTRLNRVIGQKHLGEIADSMDRWEGKIADELGLTRAVVNGIKKRNQNELNLQARDALAEWEQNNGDNATYSNLISVFKCAGNQQLADKVKRLAAESEPGPRGLNFDVAPRNDALPSGSGVNAGNMTPLEMPPESQSHEAHVDIDGAEMRWCVSPLHEQSNNSGHSDDNIALATLQQNNLWPKNFDVLHVKFLDRIPEGWAFHAGGMNTDSIMNLAQKWNKKENYIPRIEQVKGRNDPADIRVRFTGTETSRSYVGVRAQDVLQDQPTMWLNLSQGGDEYKKHLVVHEFGHALGLDHEHQRGDFWKLIQPYINEDVMRNDPEIGGAFERFIADPMLDSNIPGRKQTKYDPNSVMHYWFKSEWLKEEVDSEDKIKQNANLSKDQKAALLGVLRRSNGTYVTQPSEDDIKLLDEYYKKQRRGIEVLIDQPWKRYLIGAIIVVGIGILAYFILR